MGGSLPEELRNIPTEKGVCLGERRSAQSCESEKSSVLMNREQDRVEKQR